MLVMNRSLLVCLPLLLLAAGCKSGLEKQIVGSWTSQQGLKLTVAADKTYRTEAGPIRATGKWAVDGNDVVFTPSTVNDRPISELKARLQQRIGRMSGTHRQVANNVLHDLDRPNFVKFEADGKTLTTDSSRDQNRNPWSPLTKSES